MKRLNTRGSTWSGLRDLLLFVLGVALLAAAYGYTAALNSWFPKRYIDQALLMVEELQAKLGWKYPWYYQKVGNLPAMTLYQPGKMAPGLTLITGLARNGVVGVAFAHACFFIMVISASVYVVLAALL